MVSPDTYVLLRRTGEPRSIRTGVVYAKGTVGDPWVSVDIDGQGGRLKVPYIGDLKNATMPDSGDVVILERTNGRLVAIGISGGAPVVVPPVPEPDDPDTNPPPPKPTTSTVSLKPKATGTARGGSVRPDTGDLYQGDWTGRGVNSGMAVYGAKQLNGTVISCTVRIKRLDAGVYAAQAPTLRLMTQASLVGNPTWQDSKVGPAMKVGETRTVTLPDSWGQKLVNGTAGGIGIDVSGSSPYIRLAGKAAGFMTVTLKIRS